jgi:hypothetical protein
VPSAAGFGAGVAEGAGLGLGAGSGAFCASAGAESAPSAQASEIAVRTDRRRDVVSFATVPTRS